MVHCSAAHSSSAWQALRDLQWAYFCIDKLPKCWWTVDAVSSRIMHHTTASASASLVQPWLLLRLRWLLIILCARCHSKPPSIPSAELPIIRQHRSTALIDAAYCYRLSSVRCRSVCLSVTLVSPAKTAEPIEMPFGLRTSPWEWAIFFCGGKGVPLRSIGTLCSHLCKNGWTNQDAVWVVGSDGSKESCVRSESRGTEVCCHGNQFWDAICYNWLFGFSWAITLVVWQLATRCLILGVGFRGQAIRWRHRWDQLTKNRCHGNQFGTKIAITI